MEYKPFLIEDFHHKCGYTDCRDYWFGGPRCFHIDHFIPWRKHIVDNPNLKTDYNNLVYSCSYVNILKSDDENSNYLDPCTVDYNKHFHRDDMGNIIPDTEEGKYMFDHLRMGLCRYAIVWKLDQMKDKMEELIKVKEVLDNAAEKNSELLTEICVLISEFTCEYLKYENYLALNQ
ncbi:MAG: HNH endonuclease [Methanobrevibacter sp.]|uniref:HNH endonuclease signature motif containing protein n=1 Tax=Methanobrevibacter sp. TaxID=66852 RepID=UPI0025EBEB50|nr:HNH endonuclease signature motif containing protein [Methanobrevibacter sp.]MBR0271651.1 HNH endonuclease [Methanobrevibacter sp.]